VSLLSLSALMAKSVSGGLVLGKNILEVENCAFYQGFCDFVVFSGGKSVVSLWWNAS
jgi:hypothetical protein